VERGVWSQLDAGGAIAHTPSPLPRRWWLAAVPLAAAAAALVIVLALRTRPELEPTRFVTAATSSSVMYGDSHIELDAHTAVVMDEAGETDARRGAASAG